MTKGIKEMTSFLFLDFLLGKEKRRRRLFIHTFHPLNAFLDFLCTSLAMHVNLEHHSDDLRRLQHNKNN